LSGASNEPRKSTAHHTLDAMGSIIMADDAEGPTQRGETEATYLFDTGYEVDQRDLNLSVMTTTRANARSPPPHRDDPTDLADESIRNVINRVKKLEKGRSKGKLFNSKLFIC
jgi:hypothetical protein